MLVCRDDAHTIGIRILWGKCTTSAECKTIRIAVSAVMGVGMEAARPKGKRFCFMKGSVLHQWDWWECTWEVRKEDAGMFWS